MPVTTEVGRPSSQGQGLLLALAAQPGLRFWVVFDSAMLEQAPPFRAGEDERSVTQGREWRARLESSL